jgi:hypothetical protein
VSKVRGTIAVAEPPLEGAQRNRPFHRLLLMVLSIALVLLSAHGVVASEDVDTAAASAAENIPAPDGLRLCPPDSPIASMLARAVGQAGKVAGCFVSSDKVRLRAVPQAVDYPVEYAFAIRLAAQPSGPYTHQDIEINLSLVEERWKAYPPLWAQSKPEYEKRINDLLAATTDIGTEPLRMALAQPLLVSIDRVGELGYSVISIRQRNMSMGANSVVSTAVDGSGLMLKGGQLTRLSLVRELRAPSDIEFVKKAIAAWIHEAYQAGGSVSN